MQCPNCQATLDDDTVFCGNCGNQVAPLRARGATVDYPTERSAGAASVPQAGIPTQKAVPLPPGPAVQAGRDTPPPSSLPPVRHRRGPGFLVMSIVLLLVFAGGTVLAFVLVKKDQDTNGVAANASGQIVFFDGPNGTSNTDALRITVNGLGAPPAGSHYAAWLVDETGEHTTALGALASSGGAFSLSFAGSGSNGKAGTNLLGAGNVVEITLEQGNVQLPTGQVLLSATFPPKAFIHIKHLLFSFPTTPGKIGLLVGLLDQTRLLNAQALALQSLAGNRNAAATACIAQSIIDISEGQKGTHYQPLSVLCGASLPTGDGFGILGTNSYAATAAAHASLAATQADSTPTIIQHAREVEAAATDITGWVTTIDQDALKLLSNPGNAASVQEIVTLADHAFRGVDSNGNGQIDPIAGEEGAATAYLRGQLMATLAFVHAS